MTPREIFLNACDKIASSFLDRGFKLTRSGQCLKKISKDKDLTFEIYFRSSIYNSSCSIAIYPLISVYSKSLKQWMRKYTGNTNELGIVYHNHIGYLSPIDQYKEWELAGLSFDVSIAAITNLLEQYALPIFYLFEDKVTLLKFMEQYGCCFNSYTKNSLSALPYVYLHGGKEMAENYFNVYLQSCKCRNKFMAAYHQLENKHDIELGMDRYLVIFAFMNELKIK